MKFYTTEEVLCVILTIQRFQDNFIEWSVQFSRSVVSDTLWPHSWSPPKPMSIESMMPSNHLILCRPLLLPPSIIPSIRVFSNESALRVRWPKYWSFSFNMRPSNEHPGLISFRMDWLALLAVQGTLKSLLQHHSSKASRFPWSFALQMVKYDLVSALDITKRNKWIVRK